MVSTVVSHLTQNLSLLLDSKECEPWVECKIMWIEALLSMEFIFADIWHLMLALDQSQNKNTPFLFFFWEVVILDFVEIAQTGNQGRESVEDMQQRGWRPEFEPETAAGEL